MNLVKRNTNGLFPTVMDEMFKDWMGGTQMVNRAAAPVNIIETENDFTLELIAPGLKKEDFNIELDNELLTVSAEVKQEKNEGDSKFTRREYVYSSFRRSFTLPDTVKGDAINAVYQEGILKIALPKKEEALPKAKRLIEIS